MSGNGLMGALWAGWWSTTELPLADWNLDPQHLWIVAVLGTLQAWHPLAKTTVTVQSQQCLELIEFCSGR